jgi:hypothetical protein
MISNYLKQKIISDELRRCNAILAPTLGDPGRFAYAQKLAFNTSMTPRDVAELVAEYQAKGAGLPLFFEAMALVPNPDIVAVDGSRSESQASRMFGRHAVDLYLGRTAS